MDPIRNVVLKLI